MSELKKQSTPIKFFIPLLLTVLFLGSLTLLPNVAYGDDITNTRTLTSSSYDGYIYNTLDDYFHAWIASYGDAVSYSSNTAVVGQDYDDPDYTLYRAFIPFDTSSVPSSATINNATLSIYVSGDDSDTDFNITIQDGQPTYPHLPLQVGDYYYGWYSGGGGSRNTSEIGGVEYFNITLSDTGLTYIQKGGTTKLCLRSSLDIAGTENSGSELIYFYTAEQGSSYAPILYVTYTVSEEDVSTIILHGPYLETGAVYNGTVNATLTYADNATQTYQFDGSDGDADTHYAQSDVVPISVFWNCTTDYSKQRSYHFTEGATSDEVWLHVADVDYETLAQYYASVTDFAGLTSAYVSITKNVGGSVRIIERYPLDVLNNIPFWLIFYNQYKLKLTSDQGTWTWNFPADVVGTKNFVVTKDMVDFNTDNLFNFTCTAARTNSSFIYVYYYDPAGSTISVAINIQYYSAGEYHSAYNESDTGNTFNFTWNGAESLRDYVVDVNATYAETSRQWRFHLTKPETAPFDMSIPLDLFGDWPFEISNGVGIFVVALFFAVFSWRDVEIACGAGCVIAAVLMFVGLLDIPVMAVAMGLFIVVFMYIHKGKQTSRIPP